MISLKPLSLSDRAWIDPLVRAENSKSADFSFGTMFIWNARFHQHVAPINNRLAVKPMYADKPFYVFPIGTGDISPVVCALRDHADSEGLPLIFRGVTEKHRNLLEDAFPGKFEFTPDRDHFDYIYDAVKLSTLSGKKLHAKRNHINRFIQKYEWSFEPLSNANSLECMAMLSQWEKPGAEESEGLAAEHEAISRSLEHFDELGFSGGALRVWGKLVAFTIGERINGDTFNIHFEKAFTDIDGAYPMINREFVRHVLDKHPDIVYINREEDIGIPNLRKAKLSYAPEFLLEKYIAKWIEP